MQDILAKDIEKFNPDIIIDARSPKEFAHSKVVNAQNYYALNDEQFEQIGTIYKNQSKNKAKILGASYVCENVSRHLLELEKQIKIGSKVLIYCARGGLRSKSFGIILEQIGYRVARLKDGYKGYRAYVLEILEQKPKVKFITLYANTGSGKTHLIKKLNHFIDLEALANHQGSTFGLINGAQPSIKSFQNNLAFILKNLDPTKNYVIEGESKKIGNIVLPCALYECMKEGICVQINTDISLRVKRILSEYKNIDKEYFFACMNKIKPFLSKKLYMQIIEKYNSHALEDVAKMLLENYYDKVYKKPQKVDLVLDYSENDDEIVQILQNLCEQKI